MHVEGSHAQTGYRESVMRSRYRRALGAWLVGGLLAGLTIMPICDLHFDCGCTWPGLGGWSHCDIHAAGPPDCPWCDHYSAIVLSMVFSYGIAFAAVLRASEHAPMGGLIVLCIIAVVIGAVLSGVVTSLVLGRPILAGL